MRWYTGEAAPDDDDDEEDEEEEEEDDDEVDDEDGRKDKKKVGAVERSQIYNISFLYMNFIVLEVSYSSEECKFL